MEVKAPNDNKVQLQPAAAAARANEVGQQDGRPSHDLFRQEIIVMTTNCVCSNYCTTCDEEVSPQDFVKVLHGVNGGGGLIT